MLCYNVKQSYDSERSGYVHFDSRIRYTEINHNKGIMDPSSILNYFQDCSTFQSEDMNLGFSKPDSCRRAWLLVSWNLQIIRQVSLGEYVTVGTWPYGFKGFYGYRNFIMKDSNGQVTSVADSIWVFMDMETGYPARFPGTVSVTSLNRHIPWITKAEIIAIPDKLEDLPPFPVAKEHRFIQACKQRPVRKNGRRIPARRLYGDKSARGV